MAISNERELTISGDVNGDGIADVTLDGAGNNGDRMVIIGIGSGLNIESLTFANGSILNGSGAAIASNGDLTVLNSTFTNNYASTFGGALRIYQGTAYIANSTFDGNEADRGGAIRTSGATSTTTIVNSTFYGNHASQTGTNIGGGAIEVAGNTLILQNSTLTGNTAEQIGGGVNVFSGTAIVENSIVVGNAETNGGGPTVSDDVSGAGTITSNGGNVFGTVAASATAAGDIISATASGVFDDSASISTGGISVNAGVLGSNGGATDTVLLLQGGLAVDQGDSSDIPTEASLGLDIDGDGTVSATAADVDQRGSVRDAGASVDAGAVELNTDLIVVTTTEDTRDGNLSPNDISWREALDLVSDGGTITFDETVFTVDDNPLSNVEIALIASGEKAVTKGFHLDGDLNDDGIADVTFDGLASGDEWMQTNSNVGQITLEGVTFQAFNDSGGSGDSGGVMRSRGDLFILNSNFVDNQSGNYGGALRLYDGTQVISNSFFDGNSSNQGGAIRTTNSDTTIIGSTFTGNFTKTAGGTIANGGAIQLGSGALTLINSTLTGNYSVRDGGGVDISGGTASIQNSIIAGNSAVQSGDEVEGTFTSNGANIFGVGQTGTAAGDLVLGSAGDLEDVFDAAARVAPGGASLFIAGVAADNGGSGPTVALKADLANPALDAGDPAALDESILGIDLNFDGDMADVVVFDGRGFARSVDIPGVANNGASTVDIGAFETQTTPTPGPDILQGTPGVDLFFLQEGGSDSVSALGDNDGIIFGPAFDANDVVDGGDGTFDQLALQGDYSAGVTFANTTGIEQIALLDGSIVGLGAPGTEFYDYDLTLVDANVAAGEILEFQANSLRVGEDFTLDASAELDGAVLTFGGFGTHDLTGSQADDGFFFGVGRFGLDDRIDGQGEVGIDSVGIQGDYSAGYTFGVDQLIDIELLALFNSTFSGASSSPFSYDLTMVDANVGVGDFLIVNANQLASDEILTFDGSAETDGTFRFFSGAGADSISASQNGDIIAGGGGGDMLMGNLGNDTFLYGNLTDSAVGTEDHILDFTIGDMISLIAIDADAGVSGDQAFSFIGAAAFTNGVAGQLRAVNTSGNDWEVEADTNGDAIADLAIMVTTLDGDALTAGDFVL